MNMTNLDNNTRELSIDELDAVSGGQTPITQLVDTVGRLIKAVSAAVADANLIGNAVNKSN